MILFLFNILFQMAVLCFLGFITNYLFFQIILFGFLGSKLQLFCIDKFKCQDKSWFNKLLFYFLIIYFILNFTGSIIYLDCNKEFVLSLSNVTVTINGDYMDKLFTQLGAIVAFAVETKITAGILATNFMLTFF